MSTDNFNFPSVLIKKIPAFFLIILDFFHFKNRDILKYLNRMYNLHFYCFIIKILHYAKKLVLFPCSKMQSITINNIYLFVGFTDIGLNDKRSKRDKG